MNNNSITLAHNKQICEASDCLEIATEEIKLDVGQFGQVTIFICNNCLPKFTKKEENNFV